MMMRDDSGGAWPNVPAEGFPQGVSGILNNFYFLVLLRKSQNDVVLSGCAPVRW